MFPYHHINTNQWSSLKLLYFVFQASFHIASAFFGMIIGKSGTTRKRIESETRSRINVPKQGAPSDTKSIISLEKVAF